MPVIIILCKASSKHISRKRMLHIILVSRPVLSIISITFSNINKNQLLEHWYMEEQIVTKVTQIKTITSKFINDQTLPNEIFRYLQHSKLMDNIFGGPPTSMFTKGKIINARKTRHYNPLPVRQRI